MAAKTPTKLYSTGAYGRKTALYVVPNVTTNDTVDLSSTGTNDFSKVYIAVAVPDVAGALAATSLTLATTLTISTASLTGEDVFLFVVGAGT